MSGAVFVSAAFALCLAIFVSFVTPASAERVTVQVILYQQRIIELFLKLFFFSMMILTQPPTIRSSSGLSKGAAARSEGKIYRHPTVQLNWKLPKGFTITYSVNCILAFIFVKVHVFMHGSTVEEFVV